MCYRFHSNRLHRGRMKYATHNHKVFYDVFIDNFRKESPVLLNKEKQAGKRTRDNICYWNLFLKPYTIIKFIK